ncbi:PTS beta-glucoside transporter subunit EIIBCA [Romboutsia weinsteinii]|uniref:PTS beta-glucoside transporter subunit EIIBCA n=1 Tax=Romboutsia weinsteinii TaxID=2020949 RepID=A0A371J2M3_9FIRM|nr:beta-glucoside-specific PTS transporter subunit IIABC [Romboutsia weinsteinii]RDY27029.1 PTS beta-glucoside transporter subunit EIIBCA [Romboutsia weinsteinii]
MDYQAVAKKVLERVGGKDNIISLVHCMTRLRFTLKDESIVDDELVKKTKGVMGIMKKSGQYQVIIGNEVGGVYKEICKLGNFQNDSKQQSNKSKEKQGIISTILDVISGCMAPVIPAIIGAAMIKVLLTVLPMMAILDDTSQTYQLISVIGDGAFFFMPVLIAMSAAKKFDTNPYYAVSLALIILHPNFINLMNGAKEAGEVVKFFNVVPVTYASYSYSVIPIILSVWALSYIERFVDKITPAITKNFLKPMLVVLFAAPIVMVVIGPLGSIFGDMLSKAIYFIHDKLGFIAIGLVAGIYPFVVMAGMHHAFTPIKLSMIATVGYEGFICISEFCTNMAQGAASLAVAVKSKNKDLKQTAASCAFSALVAGITEPALYGVTVRLKRPMIGACIGAAIGGLVGGFFQLKSFGVATPALVTIPQYIESARPMSLIYMLITAAVTIAATFVATYIIGFEDPIDEDEEEEIDNNSIKSPLNTGVKIDCPIEGVVVDLSEVNDKTFSTGILGQGVAIIPTKGEIVAPFDGTIDVFFETHHAIGLRSDEGVEALIHVGLETVNLQGKYFTPMAKVGDKIKKGDLLLTFDLEAIKNEGYDTVTPVIISNSDQFMEIVKTKNESITQLETILTVV